MNAVTALLLSSLVGYCSGGISPPITNTGIGKPVCDVNEQLEFHICSEDCVAKIPDAPPANFKNTDSVCKFLACLSTCHLKPLGFAPPSAGEVASPALPSSLDDLLEFDICSVICYKNWVKELIKLNPLPQCYEEQYTHLALCFYKCVRGDYAAVKRSLVKRDSASVPAGNVAEPAELHRSKRQKADDRMLIKVEYVYCYVNCYEKNNQINILQAVGFAPNPPPSCEARDTVKIAQCNGLCYLDALNARGKRAVDSATTYDRVKTTQCVAKALKEVNHPCIGHMIYMLNVRVNDCLEAEYRPYNTLGRLIPE